MRANNVDLNTNTLDFTELKYIKDKIIVPKEKKVVKGSLIICTASGSKSHLGKVALIDKNYDYAFGGFMGQITPKSIIDSRFLFYRMISEDYKRFIGKLSDGVNINNLRFDDLANFEIPLPPLPEQKRIVSLLDEAFAALAQVGANAARNLVNAREVFEAELNVIFGNGRDWEIGKLGDVLQKTETIDPTKTPNEEYVYIDVSSVNKENLSIEEVNLIKGKDAPSRARKLVKTNDVIFATVRPTLKRIAIIPKEYDGQICSTGYFVLRGKEFIDNRLVFYFLQTHSFMERMEKLQKGASYPAVTDGEVREQIITFPKSLGEQRAIVERLEGLSKETRRLEAVYRQKMGDVEELRKSVLRRAFEGEL